MSTGVVKLAKCPRHLASISNVQLLCPWVHNLSVSIYALETISACDSLCSTMNTTKGARSVTCMSHIGPVSPSQRLCYLFLTELATGTLNGELDHPFK